MTPRPVARNYLGGNHLLHQHHSRNIILFSYFYGAQTMHEITMGEKGQVTVPKAIREHYNLSKGDQVRMIDLGNGIMEVILLSHSKDLPPPTIKTTRRASSNDMKGVAEQAASKRYRRAIKK